MKLTRELLLQGGLLAWAESEACRLSMLATFRPKGWTAVGYSRAYRALMNKLRAVEWPNGASHTLISDIIDMARLKAASR